MIRFWITFILSINFTLGFDKGFSFRSSITEEGKPILRVGISSDEVPPNKEDKASSVPGWIEDLKTDIQDIVDKHGHSAAKPIIAQMVQDKEDDLNVILYVRVSPNGSSKIEYKYQKEVRKGEPLWLAGFKRRVREAVMKNNPSQFESVLDPIVKRVEETHSVKIYDVDVDKNGEIKVKYKLKRNKKLEAERTKDRTYEINGGG